MQLKQAFNQVNRYKVESINKVLVGEHFEEKCLEGLLQGYDRVKYLRKKKVNENMVFKIKNLNDLTREKIHELNQIFLQANVLDENYDPL